MAAITFLQNAGSQQPILQTTATGPGSWVRVHPRIRNMTFEAVLTGSSVGSTQTGVVVIEASNDGVNPLATVLATITLSSLASPASDGFTLDAHYEWIRAKLNSISSSTTSAVNSSASVYVSAMAPL